MDGAQADGQLWFANAVIGGALGGRWTDWPGWYRFDTVLARLRDAGSGRGVWPPVVLFKAFLVGSFYGLSERELEAALADRLSFRRFVNLSSRPQRAQPVPQRTGREGLFGELDQRLKAAGVILRRGTMFDGQGDRI